MKRFEELLFEYVTEAKSNLLPLPSESEVDKIVIYTPPDRCVFYGWAENMVFEKDYANGLAVGWKLTELQLTLKENDVTKLHA